LSNRRILDRRNAGLIRSTVRASQVAGRSPRALTTAAQALLERALVPLASVGRPRHGTWKQQTRQISRHVQNAAIRDVHRHGNRSTRRPSASRRRSEHAATSTPITGLCMHLGLAHARVELRQARASCPPRQPRSRGGRRRGPRRHRPGVVAPRISGSSPSSCWKNSPQSPLGRPSLGALPWRARPAGRWRAAGCLLRPPAPAPSAHGSTPPPAPPVPHEPGPGPC
jgi:hypothetical protein